MKIYLFIAWLFHYHVITARVAGKLADYFCSVVATSEETAQAEELVQELNRSTRKSLALKSKIGISRMVNIDDIEKYPN